MTIDHQYVVVLRGPAAVRFAYHSGVRLEGNASHGPAAVIAQTRWVEMGYESPVPREIWVEVQLSHDSLDAALDEARVLTSHVVPVLSFVTNAEVGQVEPHLAYDATPGSMERDFIEYIVPDERGLVALSRQTDPDLISECFRVIYSSSHRRYLTLALAHYHTALSYYFVGGESLAVAHLFMAAEALREPALAEHCERTGKTEAEIIAAEGHESRLHLLAWARRELVFAGDPETFRAAKSASERVEHGFGSVGEVRAVSSDICDKIFGHVRRTICDLLTLDEDSRSELLAKYGRPFDSRSLRKRVRGVLISESDDLAAEGEEYPILEIRASIEKCAITENGELKSRTTMTLTSKLGPGVRFQPTAVEAFGRAHKGHKVVDLNIEISPSTTAGPSQLGSIRRFALWLKRQWLLLRSKLL